MKGWEGGNEGGREGWGRGGREGGRDGEKGGRDWLLGFDETDNRTSIYTYIHLGRRQQNLGRKIAVVQLRSQGDSHIIQFWLGYEKHGGADWITLSVPHYRLGDRLLGFGVACPQKRTAVQKGMTQVSQELLLLPTKAHTYYPTQKYSGLKKKLIFGHFFPHRLTFCGLGFCYKYIRRDTDYNGTNSTPTIRERSIHAW